MNRTWGLGVLSCVFGMWTACSSDKGAGAGDPTQQAGPIQWACGTAFTGTVQDEHCDCYNLAKSILAPADTPLPDGGTRCPFEDEQCCFETFDNGAPYICSCASQAILTDVGNKTCEQYISGIDPTAMRVAQCAPPP